MTYDEWCASKGYEPRRNGSLYEAWQAAIESRVLAEGKPFAYTTRADLEMMAKHNTATLYRDPVDGDIALFTRPTPDDASPWISVTDRLPEDKQMVAVYDPEHPELKVWPAQWDAENQAFTAGIHKSAGWFEKDEVTHWTPLPAMQADKETK